MPAPTGGIWRVTTICGSRKRRDGILLYNLYAGRIVYNRQRFVRDPMTRKRVSRPNPESEWKMRSVPELRIVDGGRWAAVAAIEGTTERIASMRRTLNERLLSGLTRCRTCGGTFAVVGAGPWGCSTARQSGTCENTRTISTAKLEARVLGALRDRLLQPALVAAFMEEYRREREAQRTNAVRARAMLSSKRAKLTGRIEHLTDMMADGVEDYAQLKSRLATALAERAGMDRSVEDEEVAPAVTMHPSLAVACRRNIALIT